MIYMQIGIIKPQIILLLSKISVLVYIRGQQTTVHAQIHPATFFINKVTGTQLFIYVLSLAAFVLQLYS